MYINYICISSVYTYIKRQILMVWKDENELVIVAQIPSLIYIEIFILPVIFVLF